MVDRADSSRGLVEQVLLAGVGSIALTAERLEGLVDAIAERTGLAPGEARQLVEDQVARWRAEGGRFAERVGQVRRELGLASREDVEELRLLVAQLEHRLRLLERD